MTQWMKNMIGSLCILTILLHLIPQGKFTGYVRFYGSLLFFLVAAGPVLQIFTGDGELERFLQLEFLKEEYYDLDTAAQGMEELRNEKIQEAYVQELKRQIGAVAQAYGFGVKEVCLKFDPKDSYTITGVSIYLKEGENNEEAKERMKEEIAGIYLIEKNRIAVIRG